MRTLLSDLLTDSAKENPDFMVLSGDHGYALFDRLRTEHASQFINVGVSEQAMVGIAAGLAKQGFRPVVYGLSAFVPVRVFEQIKLDVCFSNLPVIFLGDGAGLVYSTLGASHQCGEDLACLRTLPGLKIFTPADREELRVSFNEARLHAGPSYIRLGKSDRPSIHTKNLAHSGLHVLHANNKKRETALVALGSMAAPVLDVGRKLDFPCYSVSRIKPFPADAVTQLGSYSRVIAVEEHSRFGGLASAVMDAFVEAGVRPPLVESIALEEKFSEKCGSYQYALSEHGLSDEQLVRRLNDRLSLNR